MKKLAMKLALALVFVLGQVAYGDTVLMDEGWSGYSDNDVPASPWVVASADAEDTITVQDGWVLIDDESTTSTNWPPKLSWDFGQQTELMTVSFKYTVNDTEFVRAVDSPSIWLRDSNNVIAIQLQLGANYVYNEITTRDLSGASQKVGHAYSADETVTITLSNIDVGTDTFDIAWSSDAAGNPSGGKTGASFTNDVTEISKVFSTNNAGPTTTLEYSLDDIYVSVIPEPATLLLLCGVAVPVLLKRRRKA